MTITLQKPANAPPWYSFAAGFIEQLFARFDQTHIKFLRRDVTKANNGSAVNVGTLPENALILKALSGVHVHEAFNAGTANVIDIGTPADGDLYGTDLSLTALNFVPLDELVTGYRVAVATGITATVQLTGTAATTGQASVVIAYVTLPKEA